MAKLSIKNEVGKTVWRYWHKMFARKRFDKEYAYSVLNFRRRISKAYKYKTTICYKKGHTKSGYLSPVFHKNKIEFKIPNYTRAKEWKIPGGLYDRIKTASKEKVLEVVTEYILKHYLIADVKKARSIARKIIREKQTTIKPSYKFKADKSVYEELSYIPDFEIQKACDKLKNYYIRRSEKK